MHLYPQSEPSCCVIGGQLTSLPAEDAVSEVLPKPAVHMVLHTGLYRQNETYGKQQYHWGLV